MNMFKPETTADKGLSQAIAPIVDEAIRHARSQQKPREYLGASRWGEACERKLGFEFHRAKPDKGFSGQTFRIFDTGHDVEERVIEYLQLAGFEILTRKADGGQIGFFVADGKLGGHCDGIIQSGPADLPYPLVFECKSLNNKSFTDTKTKGVKVSKPVYYSQIQTYCAYFDVPTGGLFVALNKDNSELYYEHVPFDAPAAQADSDKALRVIRSAAPVELARITTDPTDFRCKFCDFHKTCWDEINVATNKPANPNTPPAQKPFWI